MKSLICALFLMLCPGLAFAQSPYSAAVTINGIGVTYFEIEQRSLMLAALGTVGDLQEQARENLIDERFYMQAASSLGISVSTEELEAGMEEFASRANLNKKQFLEALVLEGVDAESFRDFVLAGIAWRKVVAIKFRVRALVSEHELDAALALGATAVKDSVLLSELVLPLTDDLAEQSQALAKDLSNRLRGYAAFEEAALAVSAAPSRANGGKLDWIALSTLPPQIATVILGMNIGEISRPIQMPNAVALFQLRGLRQNRNIAARTVSMDFARFLIPGGRTPENLAAAEVIIGKVDTCDDLMAQADKLPEEYYVREVLPVGKIGSATKAELAKLDNDEVSTALTQGENGEFLVLLMLCGRTGALAEGAREEVRQALFTQRLEAFGNGFLQELKGDAIILEK